MIDYGYLMCNSKCFEWNSAAFDIRPAHVVAETLAGAKYSNLTGGLARILERCWSHDHKVRHTASEVLLLLCQMFHLHTTSGDQNR